MAIFKSTVCALAIAAVALPAVAAEVPEVALERPSADVDLDEWRKAQMAEVDLMPVHRFPLWGLRAHAQEENEKRAKREAEVERFAEEERAFRMMRRVRKGVLTRRALKKALQQDPTTGPQVDETTTPPATPATPADSSSWVVATVIISVLVAI